MCNGHRGGKVFLRLVLVSAGVIIVAAAVCVTIGAMCEGSVSRLFSFEYNEIAVPPGLGERSVVAGYERKGWVPVPGVQKSHGGADYVLMVRVRLAKYLPIWMVGIRPRPR